MGDRTGIEWADTLFGGPLPKRCSACRQVKPVSEFQVDRTRHDGLAYVCVQCRYPVRPSGRPGSRQRRLMAAVGLKWCRGCRAWLAASAILRTGTCQSCANAEERDRYARGGSYTQTRRQRAHARKRDLDPLPSIAQEYLTEEFEGECAFCRRPADTWDHLVAVVHGGRTAPGNIVPACHSCNSSKGHRDLYTWLDRKGYVPHPALLNVISLAGGLD